MPTRRFLWFAASFIIICAVLGGIYGGHVDATDPSASGSTLQACLKKFTRVYGVVQEDYADPVKPNDAIFGPEGSMTVGAIPAMLRTLDPHSNFFSPKAFQALRNDQAGHYFGVGMAISERLGPRNKLVPVVLYPFHGSPAERAGLRAGDVILKINGKTTDGLTTTKVADLLKGPKGTQVTVSVSRSGAKQPLQFTITRAEISQHSVTTAFMIRPGVAYIRLTKFDETSNQELTAALNRFHAAHLRGLILDLRQNPGGLLDQAVEVADHFLKKGQLIVYHYGRASQEQRYYAMNGNHGHDYPMVVIIGPQTASAAEIVTGALQDHDRALVIGQTSFGKGLVQTVFPLSDGAGLALTTAHYYTPSGRLIQRDYSDLSLYDYFNHEDEPPPSHDHVFYTDGGRKVYGGGGITPDVVVKPTPLNAIQQKLLAHSVFFNFGKQYVAEHPQIPKSFVADDAVMDQFEAFLKRENLGITPKDVSANLDYIKGQLREDILGSVYGMTMADEVAAEDSPLVQRAIAELPEAAELVANAKRYMASKQAAN